MLIATEEICIDTSEKTDFIDVTDQVVRTVENSGVSDGIANLYTTHTTTAIRINENEEGLMHDVKSFLEANAPPFRDYQHDDIERRKDVPVDEPANAHSHLKSLILGASETVPIIDNRLVLGQWQRIFFVDLDGPRKRKMLVHLMGKK